MGEQPRNAASERVRGVFVSMNDEDFMEREGHSLVTPDFVRHDHRHLVAQPPADAEHWLADQFLVEQLVGTWPTYEITEIIAVRGDRLCAARVVIRLGDHGVLDMVSVHRFDEAIERGEVTHVFDPEDVDLALAELDRLHAELTHG